MTKKSIYLYILVLFVNSQYVFAQSNSDAFSQMTDTPGELIVRLHPDASGVHLEKLSKQLGAVSVLPVFSSTTPAGQHPRLRRSYLIRFPAAWALEPLRRRYGRHPAIEAVELNRLNQPCAGTVPNDPSYGEQWNLALMNMPQAWRIERGTPDVTVAVVDSGIETRHPEFRSQLWQNADEIPNNGIDDDANGYVDDSNGWDFTDAPTLPGSGDWTARDNAPEDETGHGTHVSGIIAAAANNEMGIAGIAWKCRLMPLRAGFKFGGGAYLQNDDLAAAIVYAADNGARVINMSWGDTVNAFIIADALEYAYHRGCVLVAAAGNAGTVGAWYPAALNTVIAVAALGQEKRLYSDSNVGATIDIAAPGEEILSTDLHGGYQNLSGTSMAAAHVSGVAALMLSANPDATNTAIQEHLIATAQPLFVPSLVDTGALDAYAALTASTGLIAQIAVDVMAAENHYIEIIGSAGGVGFTAYWLEYGIGEVPDLWLPLDAVQTSPKFSVCLYKWDTSTVPEGRYTLRLSVTSEDGIIKRDRVVVDVHHTAPMILRHEAQPWFAGNMLHSVVMWQTNERAIGAVEIVGTDGNISRTVRSDSENLLHIVNLSEHGVPPGDYRYRMSVQNRAGHLRVDDNTGALYEIEGQSAPIHPSHFVQGASAARGLHAVVMNRNGRLELIAAEMDTGVVHIFEIQDNGTFKTIFSFPESFLPWAAADTDSDGLIEILCTASGATFLLEQPAPDEFPTERIWEAQGHWGRTIVDADADGRPDIFARDDTAKAISVYEADGDNTYRTVAILENPTLGNNGLGANFATGDFDGDGQIEILSADNDAEMFVYEATGDNRYRHTWRGTLPEGVPELFAAGDMDGDGRAEFAICARAGTTVGALELDIRYHHWLLTVFRADGDDTYRPVWTQRIRDVQDGGNGMTIADADNDGQNELCIAVSPNFYLVQYDGIAYRPIWHHSATSTFHPIVADVNGDGLNSVLFNSNNAFTFFETAADSNGNVSNQSTPVVVVPLRRPRLQTAVYSPPNQLLLQFDKPMGVSAAHAGRYRLHKGVGPLESTYAAFPRHRAVESGVDSYTPRSAILDRTRKRVILTFAPTVFRTGNRYQIEALQLSDIQGAELADDARTLTVLLPAPTLAETLIYPNPAACARVTFDKIPAGTDIHIYDVSGNCIASFARTELDRDKKVWDISGISGGVYIYVLDSRTERRVGKLAVIR